MGAVPRTIGAAIVVVPVAAAIVVPHIVADAIVVPRTIAATVVVPVTVATVIVLVAPVILTTTNIVRAKVGVVHVELIGSREGAVIDFRELLFPCERTKETYTVAKTAATTVRNCMVAELRAEVDALKVLMK